MKSAYELAMERLNQDSPAAQPLSDAQKAQLADIDETYKAKIAEREIFLAPKQAAAEATGQLAEADAIRKQLANERARLEEEREAKKQKVRDQ